MFSTGQLIFAISFFIVFVIVIIFTYRKDKALRAIHYKNSRYVIYAFFVFLIVLFLMKFILHN
ncbi:MAG: hypothetical protein L0J45_04675 [Psychroflexus sp.]|nr:hypothetical protein [Psychroflexus sp.]MDN6310043.1 hypothetical protein [Psychroflexus sp.]